MKIGLYFGSFNPIHIGHLIIANHVANTTDLQKIWFVVSPQNPLKLSASLLNEYDRLHLINIAIEGENKLKTSNIEFGLPKPSYTIDTLNYLKDKYPKHEFSIIMGSDSFSNITKWKNFEIILKDYPLYIFKRPGFEIDKKLKPDLILLNAPLLEIASTYIRTLIKEKKSIKFFVPDLVKEEIEKNGYYK